MTSNAILENILKSFKSQGYCQVPGYNRFGYVREINSTVVVSREAGKDTKIPFSKIQEGIEAVKADKSIYDKGPSGLRAAGLTHITSPIWSLLHFVPKSEY